jgi:dihydropteroate synthase
MQTIQMEEMNRVSAMPLVMAIVNCNDDSFYAPSRAQAEMAVEKALKAADDGASIIDFGAESSRPGAEYIGCQEELDRLMPVITCFRCCSQVTVSVDTRKAAVAQAALDAGAAIINDISALEDDPKMAAVCAAAHAQVILMHKQGVPRTMQKAPHYGDSTVEVRGYLLDAAARALRAGIAHDNIILDPGIGFGKSALDNLDLLHNLATICALGYPVLVGLSRKSFIGEVTGRPVPERLAGTIAANAAALYAGARIIRVHDVPEAVDLVRMMYAISRPKQRHGGEV